MKVTEILKIKLLNITKWAGDCYVVDVVYNGYTFKAKTNSEVIDAYKASNENFTSRFSEELPESIARWATSPFKKMPTILLNS